MVRVELERPIQFPHEAAEAHHGSDAQFSVDPHQFAEIAKDGKMGVGGAVIDGDGLFADLLTLLEVADTNGSFPSDAPEMTLVHGLIDERVKRGLGLRHIGPCRNGCENDADKQSRGHRWLS